MKRLVKVHKIVFKLNFDLSFVRQYYPRFLGAQKILGCSTMVLLQVDLSSIHLGSFLLSINPKWLEAQNYELASALHPIGLLQRKSFPPKPKTLTIKLIHGLELNHSLVPAELELP